LLSEVTQLEAAQAQADFWSDQEKARKVVGRLRQLRTWTDPVQAAEAKTEELLLLAELAAAEADHETAGEVTSGTAELSVMIQRLDFQFLLNGPEDGRGAILEIHPGAGGVESQDWAEMLLRMYTRYLDRHGMQYTTLDLLPGDEAGIKSASLEIDHPFAYGYLKSENGVHRLVRISPFDAQKRRHTSFASVFVFPLVSDEVEIDINPQDLRVDTYRASGAGGQHVNKTDSAVRITHLPTGVVASSQQERSQHRNRELAMTMLRTKLYMRALEEKLKERQAVEDTKLEIAWGSQIRNYVLQPYTKVKDVRTEHETGNVQAVLDGEIDDFIDAYLRYKSGEVIRRAQD
jgi:peptide chain release factor 2